MPNENDDDPIPYIIKNSEDLINAVNYLLMRVNRIEDRMNIYDDREKK